MTDRLGRRQPDRPRAGRLRRPAVRRRPRLHRRARLRRLLAAGLRRRRGRRRGRPGCSRSPSRCPRAPTRSERRPARVRRAGLRRPLARRRRPRGRRRAGQPDRRRPDAAGAARTRRRTSSSWSTASAPSCCAATPTPRRSSPRCSTSRTPATAGVPSTTATSLTSLGTGLHARARTAWSGFTSRIPGTDTLLNALLWDKNVDPRRVAAAPDRVRPAGRRRASRSPWSTSASSARSGLTVAAHRGADYVGADRVGERIAAVVARVGRSDRR